MLSARSCGLAFLLCAIGPARADETPPKYPHMAPLARYLVASPAEEMALARSAAPASISDDADVLTLGSQGYETAVKGKSGFVCLVERSWAMNFDEAEFWNDQLRAPICLNPASVRTVLPAYLERTRWVLSGVPLAEMMGRTQAAIRGGTFVLPEPGSMSYMLSKNGHLSDADGHWHPHVMFFVPNADSAAWGANMKGSPIFASKGDPEPVTTFYIPVGHWSDGTPDEMAKHQ